MIAVASANGSPGVTTTCLALALHWPSGQARPTVVECDPSGGDVALRYRLPLRPGLSEVAAAIAGLPQSGPEVLAEGVQSLHLGSGAVVPVVCASPAGADVHAAVPLLLEAGAKVLHLPGGTVVVDLGRLDPASVAWPVAARADLVVFVIEGTVAGAAHLKCRLDVVRALAASSVRVGVAVREADYSCQDVADVFWTEAVDLAFLGPLGLVSLNEARGRRSARRQEVWRSLAEAVCEAAGRKRPLALTSGEDPAGLEDV